MKNLKRFPFAFGAEAAPTPPGQHNTQKARKAGKAKNHVLNGEENMARWMKEHD